MALTEDMNLFEDGSKLNHKMSYKDFLFTKEGSKSLLLQRSHNVLNYFLLYGKGYYAALDDILNNNVEEVGILSNTKEIWEYLTGSEEFTEENFYKFIKMCWDNLGDIYKDYRLRKYGDSFDDYYLLCMKRINISDPESRFYLESYYIVNNYFKLNRFMRKGIGTVSCILRKVDTSSCCKLFNFPIVDSSIDLKGFDRNLLSSYLNVFKVNPFLTVIVKYHTFPTTICKCENSIDMDITIKRHNLIYSFFRSFNYSNEILIDTVLSQYFLILGDSFFI